MGYRINIFKAMLTQLIIGMGGPFRFNEVLLQLTKHSIMGVSIFELVLGVKNKTTHGLKHLLDVKKPL